MLACEALLLTMAPFEDVGRPETDVLVLLRGAGRTPIEQVQAGRFVDRDAILEPPLPSARPSH